MLRHRGKAQDLAGMLLVIEQGAAADVQRTQRRQIQRLDPQHRSRVPQQHCRRGTNVVERPTTHAYAAGMQRQTRLVVVAEPALAMRTITCCTEIKGTRNTASIARLGPND